MTTLPWRTMTMNANKMIYRVAKDDCVQASYYKVTGRATKDLVESVWGAFDAISPIMDFLRFPPSPLPAVEAYIRLHPRGEPEALRKLTEER